MALAALAQTILLFAVEFPRNYELDSTRWRWRERERENVESCAFLLFSLLLVVLCLAASCSLLLGHLKCKHGLELLGQSCSKLEYGRVKRQPPPLCNITFGPPTLQWGWAEACEHTRGGDETCELFMASEMFCDERTFLEIADRASPQYRNISAPDSPYSPQLGRLKQRLVEATLEKRPLSVLALGPSTTLGAGCPVKQLRWTDALQNLSNFRGSPLNLSVINEARGGTKFKQMWYFFLSKNKYSKGVDLIVIDYAVTAEPGDKAEGNAAVLLHAFIQNRTRPPAILFLENFVGISAVQRGKPCDYAEEFERVDPFFSTAKKLQIPMLSYPDIACHLPLLNRPSNSASGEAYYHSYRDLPQKLGAVHFGCGVHFILAHAVYAYLQKLLRDPRGGSEQSLLEESSRLETPFVAELSLDQKCEVTTQTSFTCDEVYGCNFPALVGKHSKWKLGSDTVTSLKFGWLANAKLMHVPESADQTGLQHVQHDLAKKYNLSLAKLPDTDILILLRLSIGTVFLDYLATYNHIGSATCQLEDLKGREIGPSFKVNAKWSPLVSLAERTRIFASQVPELPPDEANAVLRCREEGEKFKIIGVSSC